MDKPWRQFLEQLHDAIALIQNDPADCDIP